MWPVCPQQAPNLGGTAGHTICRMEGERQDVKFWRHTASCWNLRSQCLKMSESKAQKYDNSIALYAFLGRLTWHCKNHQYITGGKCAVFVFFLKKRAISINTSNLWKTWNTHWQKLWRPVSSLQLEQIIHAHLIPTNKRRIHLTFFCCCCCSSYNTCTSAVNWLCLEFVFCIDIVREVHGLIAYRTRICSVICSDIWTLMMEVTGQEKDPPFPNTFKDLETHPYWFRS